MKVILYKPDYNNRHSPSGRALSALSEGLTDMGVAHDVRRARNFDGEIADVAIVCGWLKKMIAHQRNRTQVIEAQEAAGKPAWCLERGFLGDREEWSALSIGGFSSCGGDFRVENMPPDRWEMFERDGVATLEPWRTGGDYILLCAQVPWDAQVDDGNHIAWLEKTAKQIRQHTDKPILFRPHPKAYRRGNPYGDLPDEFWRIVDAADIRVPPPTTFDDDLTAAAAVVCFNSNVATLAVLAGVPTFVSAPCNAWPVAFRMDDLRHLDSWGLVLPSRKQWACNLAYKQWSVDEFRRALPWKHLMREVPA